MSDDNLIRLAAGLATVRSNRMYDDAMYCPHMTGKPKDTGHKFARTLDPGSILCDTCAAAIRARAEADQKAWHDMARASDARAEAARQAVEKAKQEDARMAPILALLREINMSLKYLVAQGDKRDLADVVFERDEKKAEA